MWKTIAGGIVGLGITLGLMLLTGHTPDWVGPGAKENTIAASAFLIMMAVFASLLAFRPRKDHERIKQESLIAAIKRSGIEIAGEDKLLKLMGTSEQQRWREELTKAFIQGRMLGITFSLSDGFDEKAFVCALVDSGGFETETIELMLHNIADRCHINKLQTTVEGR